MKETLRLAISRLEWFIDAYPHDITTSKEDFLRPFKEALAQPEQEPVACDCNQGQVCHVCDPITPPQRTAAKGEDTRRAWVGLTFAEICECESEYANVFAENIEAKLKEKNT